MQLLKTCIIYKISLTTSKIPQLSRWVGTLLQNLTNADELFCLCS